MPHTERGTPRSAEPECNRLSKNLRKEKLGSDERVNELNMQVALRIQTLRTKEEKVPGPHARVQQPTMISLYATSMRN